VRETNAREVWLPFVLSLERHARRALIVAAAFAWVAFVRVRVAFVVRRVRTMPIVARANAAMACVVNWAVWMPGLCAFRMPIVVRTRATKGVEFAALSGVISKGSRVLRMGIVVRGSCATRRTSGAPNLRARNTTTRVVRRAIVAASIAPDLVNVRRTEPRVWMRRRTSVARGFVRMGRVGIVVPQGWRAPIVASVVRARATTERAAAVVVRTACACPGLL
jgi:hypothetical protein